ncbi:unnamed protein product [Ceutorhynchus assimilis]|uniref:Uncharacterized protein n=1 Tax=Ceutorhynchus assimilis TaxID=467358 RepID=A0A9N9MS25_9CUCU|nr:unnamed protein product [Ceutorhynchus assimilis]
MASLQNFIGYLLASIIIIIIAFVAQGEAYNFYYITENQRGENYFGKNGAQENVLSISAAFLIVFQILIHLLHI